MERITVIGTGYVGLVTGACLAEVGHQVICVDKDADKIGLLTQGTVPIFEPGLQEMVESNLRNGRLAFTTVLADAVAASDIIYIAVGTPALDTGDVDMTQVRSAILQIAETMNGFNIIVIKSTVPVGTARMVDSLIRERRPNASCAVVSNPEFLREGSAIRDTFQMDRIVIGSMNKAAGERIENLNSAFNAPVLHTNCESAELIKYASNAFLAAKISFINEMAVVCEKVGANIELVAEGMGMDKRIGPHFLQAGIGYGGSCFPKDTKAQLRIAENVDYDFKILRAVIEVNRIQRERFVSTIESTLGGSAAGKTIAVMGLTFKPNTDDLRDAPALDIIEQLLDRGARIRAYDPVASETVSQLYPQAACFSDPYDALSGADAMVITTEWEHIKNLNLDRVISLLKEPVIIDGRNVFQAEEMSARGFHYVSIGRPDRAYNCSMNAN